MLWVIVLVAIIYAISLLNTDKKKKAGPKVTGDISIWIVWDDKEKFASVIENFKKVNTTYTALNITVESFPDYKEYTDTLASSFVAGKAPDIFVLNSSDDTNIFDSQVLWIDPTFINPQDFRKNFKQFFWDELIGVTEVTNPEDEKKPLKVEFLKGIPVWYETLWIFYNRRYLESKDVASWAAVSSAVKTLKEKNESMIGIALWNGSTVPYASDILSQFLMLDKINSVVEAEGTKMKQWFSTYLSYGSETGENAYNAKMINLVQEWKNALDAFARDEVASVIGYPRMLSDISDKGFRKTFLFASAFPHYFIDDGKTLVNYNYFVINKNTEKYSIASDFLGYLASEEGQKDYFEQYPYYLPSLISLEASLFDKKIDEGFNITLKDFYNSETIYSSFKKGMKNMYDTEITNILDDELTAMSAFLILKKKMECYTGKVVRFENLSTVCK